MEKKGNLSINSENMMPIIKKWLYSDHDIFIREQVSNACDAITKLKKLEAVGEYKPEEDRKYEVHVVVNPDKKTLQFIDNGIGMTEDEVVEYITQIAFSGASKFLEKYKGKTDQDQIIGHFGLGFYSAFMVAYDVTIDTLSYLPDAKPVHWESDGVSDYTITDGTRDTVGTTITLYLNDDSLEFCNEYRVREVLNKYCSFMPTPIYLEDVGAEAKKRAEEEEKRLEEEDKKKREEAIKDGKDVPEPHKKAEPVPINDIHPLWTRMPKDCTKDDYVDFYRKVFNDYKEPLFWIHLNTDYPFNLRGILYFPKINTEYDALEAQIKLYNNQVFIADNIKEVIPEFLMTMKGVIDCPDLPLNVSRSALQNDGTVKKISEYISRKVADKLVGMCKTERDEYEKVWDDIAPFLKYGCLKDDKFEKKMADYMLFKNLDGKYLTLEEYRDANNLKKEESAEVSDEKASVDENASSPEDGESVAGDVVDENGDTVETAPSDSENSSAPENEENEDKEPEKSTVFYVTDEVQQAQYIAMFRKAGKDAVILTQNIDQPFMQRLEQKNEDLKFARIDSELAADFTGDAVDKEDVDSLTATFRDALKNDKLAVRVEHMTDPDIAAITTVSEENRRMSEMMKMYGMSEDMGNEEETLVLNADHALVKYVLSHKDDSFTPTICQQLFDLARISQKPLKQDEMTAFVKRSNDIMVHLTEQ